MTHKTVRIPLAASGSPAESVRAAAPQVLEALEAYRKARRGERTGLAVPEDGIRPMDASHGAMMLRWREEVDLACRMERAGEGLGATVDYRIDGDSLVLTMLDETGEQERMDEI
jgi:hypothetical protein